jgi:hypothetical protein
MWSWSGSRPGSRTGHRPGPWSGLWWGTRAWPWWRLWSWPGHRTRFCTGSWRRPGSGLLVLITRPYIRSHLLPNRTDSSYTR